VITRFAPTPSGYLHIGNAVHLRLLAMLAEDRGWQVALRIDDIDPDRTRLEYVTDIHDMIEWLDVPITGDTRSQSQHMEDYARARDELIAQGAYVCACSRTEWHRHAGPGCPRGCSQLELVTGGTALRMQVGDDDIVVWRREGIPAYHLANIVDDDAMGITHILRGEDLREATAVQRSLAAYLPQSTFPDIEVLHHDLLSDDEGRKLSKSAGVQAQPLARTPEVRARIEQAAHQLSQALTTVRP
jgi:glutamyl-tRNA synthetase